MLTFKGPESTFSESAPLFEQWTVVGPPLPAKDQTVFVISLVKMTVVFVLSDLLTSLNNVQYLSESKDIMIIYHPLTPT